jgi:Uma2 family endonuclease
LLSQVYKCHIFFVASENRGRIKTNFLDGPADLVIEVISPESLQRDRGEKFFEYEQGGVREYWLIDPLRRQADFYIRGDDELYHAGAIVDGIYRSEVLKGLWLRVGWLWQGPLPSVLGVIKEWCLPL